MNRRAKTVTLCAVFVALTAVFGAIPYVFLLPLLLVAAIGDFKTSLIVSLFFGVISLLYSFAGGSIVAVAFIAQPWIPIVPRLFVGPAAHGVYVLTDRLIKKEGRAKRILPALFSAIAGSLTNTALVVLCLVLTVPSLELAGVTILVYVPVMLVSGAIELAVNVIALPPVVAVMNKIYKKERA